MQKFLSHIRCVAITVFLFVVCAQAQTAERYVVLDGVSGLARVFNASDNVEIAQIRTGPTPNSIAISPNGRLAFVANLNGQYVSVIDLTIQSEIKRIRGARVDQLTISADGRTVVGTHVDDESITIIDAATLSIVQQFSLNGLAGDDPNSFDLFFNNPAIFGNTLYLNTSADVVAVDLGTFTVTPLTGPSDFFFFQGAENVAVTPNGKLVAAIRLNGLVIIDTATNSPVTTVPLTFATSVTTAPNPIDPARTVAYVINFGGPTGTQFSIVDLDSASATFAQVIASIPMPPGVPISQNTMVTSNAGGTRVYVNAFNANPNVVILDPAAVINNPAAAVLNKSVVSLQARAIAASVTQSQPPATAPVVADVNKPHVTNDSERDIRITGSGFAPGAMVRIGSLDPVPAEVLSSTDLRVTIPVAAPAQNATIIVTNPNSSQAVAAQQQSGILRNMFIIRSPDDVVPALQAGVTNFGSSTFSVLNTGEGFSASPEVATGPRPIGLAITPDGSRAYIPDLFNPAAVDVFNFATNSIEAHIIVNRDAVSRPGQAKGVVIAPRPATGTLVAYVVASKRRNLDLYAIGADPASPTFNTVVDDIPTNMTNASVIPGSLAVTPDGRFAFIDGLDNTGVGANFIVVDTLARTVTRIPAATLGISAFQPTMELSADGRLIVLGADDGTLRVFDVGTAPIAPALVATLQGTAPAGLPGPFMGFPRIVGGRLFSFDINNNIVNIFNFNPAGGDFSELANFLVPGVTTNLEAVPDVTPDGKLMYVPLREEDSVSVLDVDKIIAHDPAALITKIGVGVAPGYVAVRP